MTHRHVRHEAGALAMSLRPASVITNALRLRARATP